MKHYEEAVWAMLDPDATWPTLPENIDPEYGGPERYFDDCMKVEIRHARQALDDIEKACWPVDAWSAGEGVEQLRESIIGLEIGVKGRELLAQARLADMVAGA